MFRDEQAERKEYEERRRRGCEEVDPWFGHTSTDVTFPMQTPVPRHSSQPRLECAPDPSYNRAASDITAKLHSRPNSPHGDYYYGRQDTDVTAHLQVDVPKFVNPHGCPSNSRAGKGYCQEELQTPEEAHSNNQRVFDYMHPLGAHRPYPLSNVYYHSGSKPSTPCGSRSQSPARRRSRSPGHGSRRRSRTPSPGRSETRTRPRSRTPSPDRDGMRDRPRSRSPSPSRDRVRCRSRSPCPELYASNGHLPPGHNIPSKYLRCRNRCQLAPPCEECARLLDEERLCPENCAPPAGKHCGCDDRDYDRPNAPRIVCPFHVNATCPLQAGLPCYGKRPWSPRTSPRA